MTEKTDEGGSSPEWVRERLAEFLRTNPSAILEQSRSRGGSYLVRNPWGEAALAIVVLPFDTRIYDALNKVFLPDRYSAIWHTDTHAFEAIFTAYPLPEEHNDLEDRSFTFTHKGRDYECSFGESSERLLAIAASSLPLASSTTQWRNLISFRNYEYAKTNSTEYLSTEFGKPLSFWIKGMEWTNDDDVLDLVNHLNFFMNYYDNQTSRILVHNPSPEGVFRQPPRFVNGAFPNRIVSRPLENNLLVFWDATHSGDNVRRFLYNYMILEYASYYFIEDGVKRSLKRLFCEPSALSDPDKAVREVTEILSESKIDEHAKFTQLCMRCINPGSVWRAIEPNRTLFETKMVFDGGFEVDPLISAKNTEEDFLQFWGTKFPATIRKIRNALSHGKEQRMVSVITPTTANLDRLQVWIPPLAAAARDVMLFQNLL